MACRSTHSAMIPMNFGLKNLIVPVVVLVEFLKGVVFLVMVTTYGILIRMAMVAPMVAMVVHRLLRRNLE